MNQPRPSLKIGLIDSGLGGLTVLKELVYTYPAEYIYLADTKNLPYGEKTQGHLREIAIDNVAFLLSQNVEVIVIACHTLSAVSLAFLKETYPHITFYDVIQPVIQKAVLVSQAGSIGILGTTATVQSGWHKNLLLSYNPSLQISEQACPDLVPLIEQFPCNESLIDDKLKTYLASMIKAEVDTLILGCTHYPLVQKNIKKIIGDSINMVSAEQEIFSSFKQKDALNFSSVSIFTTKYSAEFELHCQAILSHPFLFQPIIYKNEYES